MRMKVADKTEHDPVNAPRHYMVAGVEVRDIQADRTQDLVGMDAVDYANLLKYILRCWLKFQPVEDLKKARFHLNALIARLEERGFK